MRKFRTSLLAPFLSTMAVLSFKKRSKDETLEGGSSSLGSVNLGGDTMSLGSLGGGLGTLSKLSELGQSSGDPSSSLLADSMPKSDKKLQEVEANVNDLKSHMESADLTTKAMKGDMDSIKSDLNQINESIRTLLNVYEAVSRQYNPFVDCDPAVKTAPAVDEERVELVKPKIAEKVEKPAPKMDKPAAKAEIKVEEHELSTPFDDDGPLDRIVRPDEDEMLAIKKEGPEMTILETPVESYKINDMKPMAVRAPAAARAASPVDTYEMDQTRRLIDHLMGKICTERSMGNEVGEADARALDLWMSEFKRIGGF